MKAYLTKYALTMGIVAIDAERSAAADDMVSWKSSHGYTQYADKGQWFADPEEALANAEMRRTKKIASLEKKIHKLKKLKFSIPQRMETGT